MNDNKYILAKDFAAFFEGCRLTAYSDSNGIPTIGIGSTKNVTLGMTITQDEVTSRFIEDMHDSNVRVISLVKIPLNDNEYATMLDLGFNLSYKSFMKLAGYLNNDKALFKDKMLEYSKDASGNYLKGLKIRRICERLLFEQLDWKTTAIELQQKKVDLPYILDKQKTLFGIQTTEQS
jgi:lysozyme